MTSQDVSASRGLRALFGAVALLMLVLWGWSLVPPIQDWGNPNEDGFSYVPLFWASLTCLPVAVLLLLGAVAGRGRALARAGTALVLGALLLIIVVGFLILQSIANGVCADHASAVMTLRRRGFVRAAWRPRIPASPHLSASYCPGSDRGLICVNAA